ncbi:toll/interleukin-1 receptor domain-containing protein [Flavobacterium cupreum]|uniref:Toll/interleukin-1 receptor domain-containing protein n=2 Tax=Flavobacterium cupreum TaxID=2133766 RepID=A0A434AC83_9FLAO|nr:toll/interleukin-1 receptor domain-containing protein [Flavobacterium cupreum]
MEIEKGLVDFGIKVLTDYNTINIGENIQEEIKKNIQNVNKILLITSQNSEKSEWIENELEIAKSLNKQILPVIFDDVMPSKLLTGIKYIKLKEINSDTLYPIYLSIKKQYNITN